MKMQISFFFLFKNIFLNKKKKIDLDNKNIKNIFQ